MKILAVISLVMAIVALPLSTAIAEEVPTSAGAEASPKPAAPVAAKEEKDCLLYEPGVTTLRGILHKPVATWVLALDKSVCVEKRDNDPVTYPAEDDVKNILFWKRKGESPSKYVEEYNEFLDQDVVVTGTLHYKNTGTDKNTGSDTGDIMMMVSHIEMAKKDVKQ